MLRSDGRPVTTPPADRRGNAPSAAAPRRLPLRFPALIAALAAFSLTLFAGYTAHLQHAAAAAVAAHPHTPPHTKTQETQPRAADPVPPQPSHPPAQRAAPTAEPAATLATDATASAEGAYAQLWASRPTLAQWDMRTQPVTLRYDPEPTQDPRGGTLGRLSSPTVVTGEEGRIHTPDRRRRRIRPMVPLVERHDERFPRQRKVEETTDWLLVIGIPSIDTDKGARRRRYQRDSWRKYPNVYQPRSGDGSSSGGATVLVKYLLAAHPSRDYAASAGLVAEAKEEKDVLYFDMKEGVWGEKKKSWAVEVGMSRKAYAWYCYAADNLRFTYLMKGDDDEFVRTRLLEAELRALPTVNKVYYGRVMKWGVRKGSRSSFPFAGGMSITMSADLVDWIRDSQAVEGAVDYYHEDVMVGRWFYSAGLPLLLASDCRHHDIHSGANKQKITSSSLCVHHLADSATEYTDLFTRFPDTSLPRIPRHPMPAETTPLGHHYIDVGHGCEK
eukprot:Rhum_TRINITY_DN13721_c2_g1::Rhum_TRINITY_DN13721_c2_g1_i1::g.63187::m.63187